MTTFEVKRLADVQGLDYRTAFKERQLYIAKELEKWDDYLQERSNYIPEMTIDDGLDEIIRLQKAIKFLDYPPPPNEVTQDMIDEVKQVTIDNLVELQHGRTRCFAHEDRSPSAYWAKRVNKLCCPVCNKMWDTISIKVERDKMGFHEAVRSLHAGNY